MLVRLGGKKNVVAYVGMQSWETGTTSCQLQPYVQWIGSFGKVPDRKDCDLADDVVPTPVLLPLSLDKPKSHLFVRFCFLYHAQRFRSTWNIFLTRCKLNPRTSIDESETGKPLRCVICARSKSVFQHRRRRDQLLESE